MIITNCHESLNDIFEDKINATKPVLHVFKRAMLHMNEH